LALGNRPWLPTANAAAARAVPLWRSPAPHETEIIATRPDAEGEMNGRSGYSLRLEGAKYGVSFGTALAIAISYTNNHSIVWAIIDGFLSWVYVLFFALFRV
jgi:hypothetical protein